MKKLFGIFVIILLASCGGGGGTAAGGGGGGSSESGSGVPTGNLEGGVDLVGTT